ncbi:hypothetical protein [Nocardia thraciensis]
MIGTTRAAIVLLAAGLSLGLGAGTASAGWWNPDGSYTWDDGSRTEPDGSHTPSPRASRPCCMDPNCNATPIGPCDPHNLPAQQH